jgi:hypothetical protein
MAKAPSSEPFRRLNMNVPISSFEMLEWLADKDYRNYTSTVLTAIAEQYKRRQQQEEAR